MSDNEESECLLCKRGDRPDWYGCRLYHFWPATVTSAYLIPCETSEEEYMKKGEPEKD